MQPIHSYNHKFVELKNRPMIDPKPIKCSNLKLDEVMKKIRDTVKEIKPKEKTFRITLEDIPAHIYRGIDFDEIRKISGDAVHFEIKADVIKDGESKTATSSKIEALAKTGLAKYIINLEDVEYISSTGIEMLYRLQQEFHEQYGTVLVTNVPGKIYGLFDKIGVTTLLKISETPEQAIKKLTA